MIYGFPILRLIYTREYTTFISIKLGPTFVNVRNKHFIY